MIKTIKKQSIQKIFRTFAQNGQPSESQMETCFRLINYASSGDVAALKEELQKGTDMNAQDYDMRTAFHIAASTGQEEVVRFFLENNITALPDRFGAFPQSDAIRNKHYAIQQLF